MYEFNNFYISELETINYLKVYVCDLLIKQRRKRHFIRNEVISMLYTFRKSCKVVAPEVKW